MPDTPSITINKQFTYRGVKEVYSNTYHFSGTTPSGDADWLALALAIWAAEAPMLPNDQQFTGYLGYAAGNEHAVSIKDYVADGTSMPSGTNTVGSSVPGDAAVWVRWRTSERTSKGKPIYLRKYFHHVAGSGDDPAPQFKSAAATYAGKMTDGSLPGGAKVCGPQGAVAGTAKVSPFFTTRTLKRRGKRPSS
jgi:hypothetical protein